MSTFLTLSHECHTRTPWISTAVTSRMCDMTCTCVMSQTLYGMAQSGDNCTPYQAWSRLVADVCCISPNPTRAASEVLTGLVLHDLELERSTVVYCSAASASLSSALSCYRPWSHRLLASCAALTDLHNEAHGEPPYMLRMPAQSSFRSGGLHTILGVYSLGCIPEDCFV